MTKNFDADLKVRSTRTSLLPVAYSAVPIQAIAPLLLINEVGAAVLLPARLVAFRAERFFLAVADRAYAVGRNPELRQSLLGFVGTIVAQRQVVFGRTAFVAVALDGELHALVLLQKTRIRLYNLLILRRNIIAVVVVEHILHVRRKQLRIAVVGGLLRRWRRSSCDRDARRGLLRTGIVLCHQVIGGRLSRYYLTRTTGIDLAQLIDGDVGSVVGLPRQSARLARLNGVGIGCQRGSRRRGRWWRGRRCGGHFLLTTGAHGQHHGEGNDNPDPSSPC